MLPLVGSGCLMLCLFNTLRGILHINELLLDCDRVVGATDKCSRLEDGAGEILRLLSGA